MDRKFVLLCFVLCYWIIGLLGYRVIGLLGYWAIAIFFLIFLIFLLNNYYENFLLEIVVKLFASD